MTKWMRSSVVAAVVAGTFGLVTTGVAAADTTYAPITISPDKVKELCEKRVPRVEERVRKLTTRINGGADVAGSTAWLKAQAQKARDSGDTARADRLDQRIERRSGQVDKLANLTDRTAKFKAEHCGGGK
ncbi:hypothetical protein [Actinosynnema sp. NPDC020468]|uniref:hypothetical protein n=1 Tax=Actinosynnema sp. NPDC020468 TaxID=3154488 RepID=UPI00340C088C